MKKIFRGFLVIIIIFVLVGIAFGISTVSKVYDVESKKILKPVKIVQISDFHSTENYDEIVYITANSKADIIVLTGDIFTKQENLDSTLKFIDEISKLAPVYYINGNNDNPNGMYSDFKKEIENIGVVVLENESVDVEINNQQLRIIGIQDNSYSSILNENYREAESISKTLASLIDENKYNIVLSHRPQYFNQYVKSGADLVLTGHTHGGMMMVPIINQGLIASDQGLLPEYDYGLYAKENTTMIINSGCASRGIIPRLYNPKEIVTVNIT